MAFTFKKASVLPPSPITTSESSQPSAPPPKVKLSFGSRKASTVEDEKIDDTPIREPKETKQPVPEPVDEDESDESDEDAEARRQERKAKERAERPPTRAMIMAKKLVPHLIKQANVCKPGQTFKTTFTGPLYEELANMAGGVSDRVQSFCLAACDLSDLLSHCSSTEYPFEKKIECVMYKWDKPLRAMDGFRTRLVGAARKEMKEKKLRAQEKARKSLSA